MVILCLSSLYGDKAQDRLSSSLSSGMVYVRSQGASSVRVQAGETDLGGDKVLYTPCYYWYEAGNTVTYDVPRTHYQSGSTLYFEKWTMGGKTLTYSDTVSVTTNSGSLYIDCHYTTNKKVYELRILSYGANFVPVTVSLNDKNGDGYGLTPFYRYYDAGRTVTLTAPASKFGDAFLYWALYKDGNITTVNNMTATFVASDYDSACCVYVGEDELNTLNVNSVGATNVPITITGSDINGNSSGTTPFSRSYLDNYSVDVTAPTQSGGKYFSHWESGGQTFDSRGLTITFESGDTTTITAHYSDTPPDLALNRDTLNFGCVQGGANPPPQTIIIKGNGDYNWSIVNNYDVVSVSPSSGSGDSIVTVSFDMSQGSYSPGSYSAPLGVIATGDTDAEATFTVNLNVKSSATNQEPFGDFATPADGSSGASSIAVTGWALDDTGVSKVELYANLSTNVGHGVYIGDAILVEGARPDLENVYNTYPGNYKAGWGYMMLTNFLPFGDETYRITAIAHDSDGKQAVLGSKNITIDNANAVNPFGAIDYPQQGGTASGASFQNNGWVLTPQPNKVPEDGSTIFVYVDGIRIGNCEYNIPRSDISHFFPGYANSDAAAARFTLDTTAYSTGLHSISWSAQDNAGNIDGIGSRFFVIDNGKSLRTENNGPKTKRLNNKNEMANIVPFDPDQTSGTRAARPNSLRGAILKSAPVAVKKDGNGQPIKMDIHPDEKNELTITMKVGERLEIRPTYSYEPGTRFQAHLKSGNKLKTLPVGASIDSATGTLYWAPVPGFNGKYTLFISSVHGPNRSGQLVNVIIQPELK
jgi:hypothetical protein